jgi:hypothetical protein
MKAKLLILPVMLSLSIHCSNKLKVAPAGPSIPDQLNSRGYIITPADTIPRVDTSGLKLDSL